MSGQYVHKYSKWPNQTLCGLSFKFEKGHWTHNFTIDDIAVTCPKCLKKINQDGKTK